MGEIEILIPKLREIAIVECILLVFFGDGVQFQETCLT